MIPVILSGGVGSRLWPVSREESPKPFMALVDERSLIQNTFLHVAELPGVQEVLTVTNRGLFFRTDDEYRSVNANQHALGYVLEPFGRNTTAAVASAALQVEEKYGREAHMLVLPADNVIKDQVAFATAIARAINVSAQGWLVALGVPPTRPETGYAYIECDPEFRIHTGIKVKNYLEKPDRATAELLAGKVGVLWSSGIFCGQVSTVLDELERHAPDILAKVRMSITSASVVAAERFTCLSLNIEHFADVRDISIDNAVMSVSQKLTVIPCDIGWRDVGAWAAASELKSVDAGGNHFDGEVVSVGAQNNYVRNKDRLVAMVAVEGLLVVDTVDALLVASKERAQDVKQIVEQLRARGHSLHLRHRASLMSWGEYVPIEHGEQFKVQRIVIRPGASLSLELHEQQCLHWVVVSGVAEVSNAQVRFALGVNDSTVIQGGVRYRLQNPGTIDLVLVEVEGGSALTEGESSHFQNDHARVVE